MMMMVSNLLRAMLIVPWLLLVLLEPAAAQKVRLIEWNRGHSPIALIFIHGLGGCAVPKDMNASDWCGGETSDSFRHPNALASWPAIVTADSRPIASKALAAILTEPLRMQDLGVWAIDYSRLTTHPCTAFSIPELARAIRAQLETSNIFERYEQIIFVAHSLGGLVTKSILAEWAGGGDQLRRTFLSPVIGVMLLGVPSQGSPLARNDDLLGFLRRTLALERIAGVCDRQVDDLFPGGANTYLGDLERRWEGLLGGRRDDTKFGAPLVYCAYETVAEPLPGGASVPVVPALYAQTTCSDAAFPLGVPHTQLPKPLGPEDDVHRAWLSRSLDRLLQQWATWSLVSSDFAGRTQTIGDFAKRANGWQNTFSVDVDDDVRNVRLRIIKLEAPNVYAAVSKLVIAHPELCMEAMWPKDKAGIITIRRRDRCIGTQ